MTIMEDISGVGKSVKKRLDIQTEGKDKPQQGTGVRCPSCGGRTRVVRTIPLPESSIQGRNRTCDDCGTRFYTEEQICNMIEEKDKGPDEKNPTD